MMGLNVITLNVRGLTSNLENFMDFMNKKNHIDIFCLQETKLKNSINFNGFNSYFGTNDKSAGGTAILIRNGITILGYECILDRLMYVIVKKDSYLFIIINIYVHNQTLDKLKILDHLDNLIKTLKNKYPNGIIIVGGDFNIQLNKDQDKLIKTNHHDSQSANKLNNIIDQNDLSDLWRYVHGKNEGFTFKNHNQLTRIDYFLVSYDHISHFDIKLESTFSDHNALILQFNKDPQSYLYWKLNVNILNNNSFRNQVIKLFKNIPENDQDLFVWWDKTKIKIKKLAIHFCSLEKKKRLSEEKNLRLQLDALYKKLKNLDLQQNSILNYFQIQKQNNNYIQETRLVNQKIEKIKEKIKDQEIFNINGAYIRSRTKNLKETPTKIFYGLEKHNAKKKIIHDITDENSNSTNDKDEIRNIFTTHFKNIFEKNIKSCNCNFSNNLNSCDFCFNFNVITKNLEFPLLDNQDNIILNSDFTLQELEEAFKNINKNSAPGLDGLPFEFYLSFQDILNPILIRIFNLMKYSNLKPNSFKENVTILLPKIDDPITPKDYRPITMANSDTKLFSKILVNRFKKVLNIIIDEDQSGLPNRNIQDAIIYIKNTFDLASSKNLKLILAFLDFEKAYDNLFHDFIILCLLKFNFTKNFCQNIKTLILSDNFSYLNINNVLSDNFFFLKGVKQGCPLSPILFNTGIEIFAIMIRSYTAIQSIKDLKKIKLYLDDTTLILDPSMTNFLFLKNVIDHFSFSSNLKINWKKSNLLSFNLTEDSLNNLKNLFPTNFKSSNDLIMFLGAPITKNRDSINNYWNDKLIKSQNILNLWKKHYLSLKGKVLILNSLIHSLFIHDGFSSQPPGFFFSKLKALQRDFLWHKKKFFPLSLEKLSLPSSKGGLNLIIAEDHFTILRFNYFIQYVKENRSDPFFTSILKKWNNDSFQAQLLSISKIRSNSSRIRNSNINFITSFWNNVIDSIMAFNKITNIDYFFEKTNRKKKNGKKINEWSNKELRNYYSLHTYGKNTNFILKNYDLKLNEPRIWKNLWKPNVKMKYNEVFYLFLHKSLGLMDRTSNYENQCSNCKKQIIPTHYHIFIKCQVASESLLKNMKNLHFRKQEAFIFSGGLFGRKNQLFHRIWFYSVWKNYTNNSFNLNSR